MGMFLMPLTFTEKREESVVGGFFCCFVSVQQSDSHSFLSSHAFKKKIESVWSRNMWSTIMPGGPATAPRGAFRKHKKFV